MLALIMLFSLFVITSSKTCFQTKIAIPSSSGPTIDPFVLGQLQPRPFLLDV